MKTEKRKKNAAAFGVTLIVILAILAGSILRTDLYNRKSHSELFAGPGLFSPEEETGSEVSAKAVPRSSTWTKCLDLYDEGLEEHNFQAYTYDFTVSIKTFTGFIDAKDPYTNGHSKRVALYTKRIARECGYYGEELDRIYYMALLHDCGKIGVPDSILGKPGKLTEEEFRVIKSHTVRGGDILNSFKSLEDADEGARYHHERYDGKGYPEGKAGEDIPLIARMICVADSFDAMNTDRVYRKKLSKERIVGEIENNKGKQFDPKFADVLLRLIQDEKINV